MFDDMLNDALTDVLGDDLDGIEAARDDFEMPDARNFWVSRDDNKLFSPSKLAGYRQLTNAEMVVEFPYQVELTRRHDEQYP